MSRHVRVDTGRKKHLVGAWFRTGGINGLYDWKRFLEHFDEQFEDEKASLEATEVLGRMRMGSHQYFEDFVNDFERQYALCDENTWGLIGKIALIYSAINEQLREALVSIELSVKMGYKEWIAKVAKVALRLQALQKYRPKGANQIKTWFVQDQGTTICRIYSSVREEVGIDGDGDTLMGGVNAISSSADPAKKGIGKKPKPRAPWKTAAEFNRLERINYVLDVRNPDTSAIDVPRSYRHFRLSLGLTCRMQKRRKRVGKRGALSKGALGAKSKNFLVKDGRSLDKFDSPPFLVDCLINNYFYANALVDTGCLCFYVIDENLARKNNLRLEKIEPFYCN
ncbi:hypothetical protein K3495_g6117 [Podosphaera aphanis]|nr:hypothetical protein K3495_g6117 [Podosphaera aphanis]